VCGIETERFAIIISPLLPPSIHIYNKTLNFTFIMSTPFFLLLVSCGRQKSVALRPPGKRLSVHLRPQWTSSRRPQRTTALAVQVGPKLPFPHAPPNPLNTLSSHMLMLKPQMPLSSASSDEVTLTVPH
jgi:hypothetical protein